MLWIDKQFARTIGTRLSKFTQTSDSVFTFRCPICGDSEENENKTRGYFYPNKKQTGLSMKCHNCGASMSFASFIKDQFPSLYAEYSLEKLRQRNNSPVETKPSDKKKSNKKADVLTKIKPITEFHKLHPAMRYVLSRSIPQERWSDIFYTTNFRSFVEEANEQFYTSYDLSKFPEEPRLIFLLKEQRGHIVGCQSRIFGAQDSKLRYITLMFDEEHPKIFGRDRIDLSKPIKVIEGAFDSMFLENTIASCGSDLINEWVERNLDKSNTTLIFDNEPRNVQIVKKIEKAIKQGWPIVLWDVDSKLKDINQMIDFGMTKNEIEFKIKSDTYQGAAAFAKFLSWKKV